MSTQELVSLLNRPDDPKATMEELNTCVDDAGHRLPRCPADDLPEEFILMLHLDMLAPTFTTAEAIDMGKRGALSESATERRIRNWLQCQVYQEVMVRKMRQVYAKTVKKWRRRY